MQNGTHEQTDTIVVGGGLAGLMTATLIARGGRSVTLLERSSTLGGRAMTTTLGGFEFNLGPHAVYKKGPLASLLRELGVTYTGKVPPNSGYAITGGALHSVSLSPAWFLTTKLIGSRTELFWLFARIRTMNVKKFTDVSIGEWLEREVRDPGVRALVRALIRIASYSNNPELSAGVALSQLQMAQSGVLYLDHGWQTLIDGLRAVAEGAGVRIETNAPVEAVDHDGAVRGVRLKGGRTLAASTIVLALPPDIAATLVDAPALHDFARSAVPVRAACLDVGLRRLPQPGRGLAFGLDDPLYYSVHSRVARLAPEGCAAIHVAKYLAPDDIDARAHERQLEACLDLVQPGWRDELLQRRYLPNMTVVPFTATAALGGLAARPGPAVEGIENLYVAGDWVGGEGWLSDASAASAKRVAELVLRKPLVRATNAMAAPAGVGS
jgi:phytoene dehydrogenase-like protein